MTNPHPLNDLPPRSEDTTPTTPIDVLSSAGAAEPYATGESSTHANKRGSAFTRVSSALANSRLWQNPWMRYGALGAVGILLTGGILAAALSIRPGTTSTVAAPSHTASASANPTASSEATVPWTPDTATESPSPTDAPASQAPSAGGQADTGTNSSTGGSTKGSTGISGGGSQKSNGSAGTGGSTNNGSGGGSTSTGGGTQNTTPAAPAQPPANNGGGSNTGGGSTGGGQSEQSKWGRPYEQTLATINAFRASRGKGPFAAKAGNCAVVAKAIASNLDGATGAIPQHTEVTLAHESFAADYVANANVWSGGTLTVYQCS